MTKVSIIKIIKIKKTKNLKKKKKKKKETKNKGLFFFNIKFIKIFVLMNTF
jgi:hypothetical protein